MSVAQLQMIPQTIIRAVACQSSSTANDYYLGIRADIMGRVLDPLLCVFLAGIQSVGIGACMHVCVCLVYRAYMYIEWGL